MKKLFALIGSNTLIDFFFFASIPYLFIKFITENEVFFLVAAASIVVFRGLWYLVALRVLERTLKAQHDHLSHDLFSSALSFPSVHHRLNLNAEVTNYVYGRMYNSAMLAAETGIIFIYILSISYLFGYLATVFLLVLALMIAPILWISKGRAVQLAAERIRSEEKRQAYVNVASSYPLFISFNGTKNLFIDIFMKDSGKFSESLAKILVIPQQTKVLMEVFVTLMFAAGIYLTWQDLNIEKGSIVLGLSLRLLPALSRVASLLEGVRMNGLSFPRIKLSLEKSENSYQFNDKSEEIITFFEQSDASVAVLVGDSGVGKTSSLNKALSRLVAKLPIKLKYFPQSTSLDKLTLSEVRELFGRRNTDFQGLDSDKRYETLSGGQKTSLLLELVFDDALDLIVLDEPTTGLDRNLVDELIRKIKGSKSRFLIVSHDAYFIQALPQTEIIDFND